MFKNRRYSSTVAVSGSKSVVKLGKGNLVWLVGVLSLKGADSHISSACHRIGIVT